MSERSVSLRTHSKAWGKGKVTASPSLLFPDVAPLKHTHTHTHRYMQTERVRVHAHACSHIDMCIHKHRQARGGVKFSQIYTLYGGFCIVSSCVFSLEGAFEHTASQFFLFLFFPQWMPQVIQSPRFSIYPLVSTFLWLFRDTAACHEQNSAMGEAHPKC